MNISTVSIQPIIDLTERLGGKVPADLTKAVARVATIREAVAKISRPHSQLAGLVLAAIDAKRDPASDPEVQAIFTAGQLGNGITDEVVNIASADLIEALRASVDDLVEAWQSPFNEAATQLVTAAAALGTVELEDYSRVLHAGPKAAEQWQRATEADSTLRAIIDAWTSLMTSSGSLGLSRHHYACRITEPTLDQWVEHGLHDKKISPWQANRMGLTLSLATRESFTQRIASMQRETDTRQRRANDEAAGKYQKI